MSHLFCVVAARTAHAWIVGLLVALVFGAGCSPSGPVTYPVSGEVTFDGAPVKEGDIFFVPTDPTIGPDADKIKDGKFAFRATAGPKKVEIRASRLEKLPPGKSGAMGETEMPVDFIPERYNKQTELTAEVTAGGKNEFVFPLKSK